MAPPPPEAPPLINMRARLAARAVGGEREGEQRRVPCTPPTSSPALGEGRAGWGGGRPAGFRAGRARRRRRRRSTRGLRTPVRGNGPSSSGSNAHPAAPVHSRSRPSLLRSPSSPLSVTASGAGQGGRGDQGFPGTCTGPSLGGAGWQGKLRPGSPAGWGPQTRRSWDPDPSRPPDSVPGSLASSMVRALPALEMASWSAYTYGPDLTWSPPPGCPRKCLLRLGSVLSPTFLLPRGGVFCKGKPEAPAGCGACSLR